MHPAIHTTDVYQLLCHVLRIPPGPHNGTWTNVVDMLSSGHKRHSLSFSVLGFTLLLIISCWSCWHISHLRMLLLIAWDNMRAYNCVLKQCLSKYASLNFVSLSCGAVWCNHSWIPAITGACIFFLLKLCVEIWKSLIDYFLSNCYNIS